MGIEKQELGIVKANLRVLLILAICALLGACGFHLRGEAKLAPTMQRVYVSSSDLSNGPLKRNVEGALRRSGATIEEKAGANIAEVRMSGVGIATVVRSIGANAQVNEFVMVYHVDLEIVDQTGKVVLTKQPLEQQRSFTFDQTQAIGTGSEQQTIQREMERDMAQTVVRKIDSLERRLTQ